MAKSFSVIVPVFNKENEIVRSLESIEASIQYFYQHYELAQTIEAEVLVVNEGSTDRTLERVLAFSQDKPHYKIITHFKSLGAGPARNTGAKLSRGDILFFCDGDDLVFREHFYLCFRVLDHQPTGTEAVPASFVLETDRGAYTIHLPNHPVGIVRTGVHMQDALHPYWKGAIENTLMQNMGIRRECHEFVEGFPEAPLYKKIVCEDISYVLWTVKFFKLLKVELETVEYIRYPGNHFDRQLKKFQSDPQGYQEDISPEHRELHAIRHQLEQEKLNYLFNKFQRTAHTTDFLALTNWYQLASEYLNQQQYEAAVTLLEQGMTAEPSTIANAKNLLAVAYNNLGSLFHRQQNLPLAVHYFKQSLATNPALTTTDLAKLHFNVATVLKEQGAAIEALTYLEKALIFDPQLPEATAALPIVQYKVQVETRGYQFTQDWFSHNIPIWQQCLDHFVGQPDLRALEIGSWEGRSTCWLLDNILTHNTARITCIDTFEGSAEHQSGYGDGYLSTIEQRFDFNLTQTGHPEKARKLVGKSQEVLRSLIPQSYHLVYIDGSHIASDVLEDTILTWGLVQVGGIFIFDDYGFQFADTITESPPKAAIDTFLTVFAKKVKVLHQGYQVILEKIA